MIGKTNKQLTKGIKNLVDCQLQIHKFEYFNILGYGCTNFPEKLRIRKIKNKKQKKTIENLYKKIFDSIRKPYLKRNKKKPTIFLSHNMLYKTKMDKINAPGSPVHGKHYGSTVSKEFVKKYQPLVCIGGHMHEYFGKEKVGKTTVINSGYGAKVNTLLELKNGKIKKIQFICKDKKKGVNKKIGWR
jgi:Icc-related predicted phosphoesterase